MHIPNSQLDWIRFILHLELRNCYISNEFDFCTIWSESKIDEMVKHDSTQCEIVVQIAHCNWQNSDKSVFGAREQRKSMVCMSISMSKHSDLQLCNTPEYLLCRINSINRHVNSIRQKFFLGVVVLFLHHSPPLHSATRFFFSVPGITLRNISIWIFIFRMQIS